MVFELTHNEVKKFNAWKESLPPLKEIDVWGEVFQYEFIFYPTGLGTTKIVRRSDGLEIDLTDYSKW